MNEKNSYLPQKADVFVPLRIGLIRILLGKPKSLLRQNIERFVVVNVVSFTKTNKNKWINWCKNEAKNVVVFNFKGVSASNGRRKRGHTHLK